MKRLENLDGLRGLAAMLVVTGHVCNLLNFLPSIFKDGGPQIGVQLFFCLSGFLMGMLYLRAPFGIAELVGYYRRRVARVFPMYLAVVLASFALFHFTGTPILYAVDTSNIADHLLLIDATSVLWTVPVEVHFYLLFGLIWLMFSINRSASILLLVAAIPLLLVPSDPMGFRLYFASFFLAGIASSMLPTTDTNTGFIAALVLLFSAMPEVSKSLGLDFVGMWKSPLNVIAVSVLVYTSIAAPMAKIMLGNSTVRYLGTISYSIYLVHWPVMAALMPWVSYMDHPALYALCVFSCTTIAATLTYFCIERPMRRLIMAQGTLGASIDKPLVASHSDPVGTV